MPTIKAKQGGYKILSRNVGREFAQDRYLDRYNGEAKVTSVEEGTGKGAGTLYVHMSAPGIKGEIIDAFVPRTKASEDSWNQTMVNRYASMLLSAGAKLDMEKSYTPQQLRATVKAQMVGKKVTISQFTRSGQQWPNINYFFDDGEEGEGEVEEDEDEIVIDGLF